GQCEFGCRSQLLGTLGREPLSHLLVMERIRALVSVFYPVPEGIQVGRRAEVRKRLEPVIDESHFGRAHEPAILVDPHSRRNIDHAIEGADQMIFVYQGGVRRLSRSKRGTRDFYSAGIFGDADQLEVLTLLLLVECLPAWQVLPTPSPGCPGYQQHFFAAKVR